VNPFDEDDNDGLSFDELPPSVRRQVQQQQPMATAPTYAQPQYAQPQMMPAQVGQPQMQPRLAAAPTALAPVPVEQYRQQQPIYQMAPAAAPVGQPAQDWTPWIFVVATAVLGGVGWWAYKKMEKDRKFRVGPPRAAYDDSGEADVGGDEDDGESAPPLDDYADAALPEKDVDPHEDGGIKMVRG
jgi:hypothetical protein